MDSSRFKNLVNYHKTEFILTGLAQIVYMSQSLVQNKLFAVYFDTDGFGLWSLLVSVYSLISMLPFSATDQGVQRIAPGFKKDGREKSLYSMLLLTYAVFFSVYMCLGVGYHFFFSDNVSISVTLFLLYAFSEVLKNAYISIDNVYRNRKRVLYVRLIDFGSRFVFFLLLGFLHHFTINNVLIILVVTNIAVLLLLKEFWTLLELKIDKDLFKGFLKNVFRFAMPLMTWAIFSWMYNMIGRWYLDALVDKTGVAMYSMLMSISFFIPNAFYTIVATYIMPIVYSKEENLGKKRLGALLLLVFGVLLIYQLFICFLGKYLILILADSKYLPITGYLPYTTLSSIIYVVGMLSTVEVYRQGKTSKLLIPSIAPGIFMATAGYFLIKGFGLQGAIINHVAGQLIYCLLVAPVSYKSVNKAAI